MAEPRPATEYKVRNLAELGLLNNRLNALMATQSFLGLKSARVVPPTEEVGMIADASLRFNE